MPDPRLYAVFALLDDASSHCIRQIQLNISGITGSNTALLFPVHITLRGRFWGPSPLVVNLFREFGEKLQSKPISMSLRGPTFKTPDLMWLEVAGAMDDMAELRRLHRDFDDLLRVAVIRDEVDPLHSGNTYKPHITLGWAASETHTMLLTGSIGQITLRANVSSLALARYPGTWPITEKVELVEHVPIPNSAGSNRGSSF